MVSCSGVYLVQIRSIWRWRGGLVLSLEKGTCRDGDKEGIKCTGRVKRLGPEEGQPEAGIGRKEEGEDMKLREGRDVRRRQASRS